MAGKGGTALRQLVSAVLARGVCSVIPLFFYAAEIEATEMLLFFRKSAAVDILTISRANNGGICAYGGLPTAPNAETIRPEAFIAHL